VIPFLQEELSELPLRLKEMPHTELITCHPSMVQIKVRLVHKITEIIDIARLASYVASVGRSCNKDFP